MATAHPRRSGAQVLIDQLRIHGTETIFGVPGESYLAALDALYAQRNSIRYVICRQEGGASYMAEAYGKLTGKPGICFVTRGPGATNAAVGMHTGFQDSTPMILLVGQVARETTDREAFQEIDYRRMYGQMAKWVCQIEDARRIPNCVSHAFHTALNGRPGPGRAGAAGGHADRRGRGRRCRSLQDRARRAGGGRHGDAAPAARGGQAAARDPGRRRLDAEACADIRASSKPTTCRSPPRSATRT